MSSVPSYFSLVIPISMVEVAHIHAYLLYVLYILLPRRKKRSRPVGLAVGRGNREEGRRREEGGDIPLTHKVYPLRLW